MIDRNWAETRIELTCDPVVWNPDLFPSLTSRQNGTGSRPPQEHLSVLPASRRRAPSGPAQTRRSNRGKFPIFRKDRPGSNEAKREQPGSVQG